MGKNQNKKDKNGKGEVTFIDLFAGAGGFSEGFLQAEKNDKVFKFLLASDINENCELTHVARYNQQLELDIEFLHKDIQSRDFIEELRKKLNKRKVDVICGGPPCQSFSLAGRRRAFDIKDDLFSSYLQVVRELKPKYFVMENVVALLTKENGRFKERIKTEIKSIIRAEGAKKFFDFLGDLRKKLKKMSLFLPPDFDHLREAIKCQIDETKAALKNSNLPGKTASDEPGLEEELHGGVRPAQNKFTELTRNLEYHVSKTDENINTIRHALRLLTNWKAVEGTVKQVEQLKKEAGIDDDHLAKKFTKFCRLLTRGSLKERIKTSLKDAEKKLKLAKRDIKDFEVHLDVLTSEQVEGSSEDPILPGEAEIGLAFQASEKFGELTSSVESTTHIRTIRSALGMLKLRKAVKETARQVMQLKKVADVDNDKLVGEIDDFLKILTVNGLLNEISNSLDNKKTKAVLKNKKREIGDFSAILEHLAKPFADLLSRVEELSIEAKLPKEFEKAREAIQLYQLSDPYKLNASDYGVPQNRIRAVFIGCRWDQELIKELPETVPKDQRVTVEEALYDLDNLSSDKDGRKKTRYGGAPNPGTEPRKRNPDGQENPKGKTYAEWSKKGRLRAGLVPGEPEYYKTLEAFNREDNAGEKAKLHNHEASNHNPTVRKRLEIIRQADSYSAAAEKLKKAGNGVKTNKRNYQVLDPNGQSPTVVTLPDDFIHYAKPRAPTVREMARLQSFDDSFVFQGKRNTGGHRRKDEVPQFTLVGNAVAPLMARAIGNVILENIK